MDVNAPSQAIVISCSVAPDTGSGISTYSKLISSSLRSRFRVYYLSPEPKDTTWYIEEDITPIYFDPTGDPQKQTLEINQQILNIDKLSGVINNDVIFIQSLAPVLKVPLLSVVHLNRTTIGKAAVLNSEYTDYTIAISYDMYRSLLPTLEPMSLVLLHNGVKRKPRQLRPKSSVMRLAVGGKNSHRKGGDLVIKLCDRLKESELEFKLEWFGDVSTQIIKRFADDKRFVFRGRLSRDEFLNELANSCFFLFPSREEGCPMALKEAMEMGLVPIAADGVGAMKEIINNGLNGYLLDIKNWDRSAFSLINVLGKVDAKVDAMSQAARQTIHDRFLVDRVTENLSLLLSMPTVSRHQTINEIDIYSWHRLPQPHTKRSIFAYIRIVKFWLGVLDKNGVAKVSENLD